jgi:predicted phage replisome organizer
MSTENKRFYWIKLRENFFQQETIDWLMEQENGSAYIVLYLKMCLLTANTSGELIRTIGDMTIPYEPKKISQKTGFDIDTVNVALSLFKHLGLIEETQEGIPVMPEVKNMVGSESESAARVRKYRKKKKALQSNTEVTNKALQSNVENRDKSIENRDKSKENRDKEEEKEERHFDDDEKKKILTTYQKEIHPVLSSSEYGKLYDLIDEYGAVRVLQAIERAVLRGKRSIGYINGILDKWRRDGYDEPDAARSTHSTSGTRSASKEELDNIAF